MDSLQDQSIGLILVYSGLNKFSVQKNPNFTNRLFQTNVEGRSGIICPIFPVPILNAKETGEIEYYIQDLLVSYNQNASNSCCFSNLASEFTAPE